VTLHALRRHRRSIVLAGLALAFGGLAAAEVGSRVEEIEARVGPPVPVVVAEAPIAEGTRIEPELADRALAVREVPQRYAPPEALSTPEEAVGLATAVAVAPGAYLTLGQLGGGEIGAEGASGLARGERAVDLAVAGGERLTAQGGGPGARVDVLVTTEPESHSGRTYVALENAELLEVRPGDGGAGGGAGAEEGAEAASGGTIATLRVTLRQAVYLTAAQNFAREIRLLARAPGDRRRTGGASVQAGEL
jgi:pilus assembly protein CpaB